MLQLSTSEAFEQYDAPNNEMEEKMAQIWCELLDIENISQHDNFFELGGDSLMVVKLLAELRKIGMDTTVQNVFDAPDLATLASTLESYKAVTIPPNLITANSTEITPEMLPLITLSQADIDSIIAHVSGGIANIEDIYGLTPLQSGMLYYRLMAKEGDSYLMTRRLRFIDQTSLERYANAIQQVIERHDILRTAIFWDGLTEPAQVVLRKVPSIFTEIKLNESDKPTIDRLSEEFHPQSYRLDLTQAPLLRLQAAEESDGSWVAVQLMHHLVSDHFSRDCLNNEIKIIMNGNVEMLKEPQPFRHFVAQSRLGMSQNEHTRFFSEMLGDIDEPTLPFGLTGVEQDGSEINEANSKLPQSLSDQLREHARKLQVSLASICHLAWAQVLAKASGREAVVFGTVLLGRLQAGEGSGNVMGPTINTLPMRLNIDNKSVETAVRNAHAELSALLTHEHAPLVLAQRCSDIPAGMPLFSGLLNYRRNQTILESNTSLPGVRFLDSVGQTNYPLYLAVDDDDSSLSISVSVLSPISAARVCAYMQQSLESLIVALAHTPQHPIKNLRVIPSDERTLQLHSWNQTTVVQSTDCCIHQVFEAQVECNKQAIAVECEGHTLSYSEVNMQANRIAHYLIAQGVKPDDRIALCVERSTAMMVGILGILKAGCAYIPLDPAYPSQRLTNVLHDADPAFLLADSTGRSTVGDHQVPVIELEKPFSSDLPIENTNASKLGLMPAHLAYIIYTSGSTGTPKGVMVEHQHIVRHLEATDNKYDFNQQDNWCWLHSFSFDMSLSELWGALWYGGQLFIVPYHITQSIDELYDWICSNGISVLIQTPSEFKMVMRSKNIKSRADQLRYIICGGENFDPIILRDWYENYDNSYTTIVNRYGPTEAVVNATVCFCDSTFTEKSMIPIGRPLSHKLIYLLDEQREPVPIGATGEIYIGGACVARGYLNRHDLTAERFPADPFSEIPTARMYQTGDLARYLPDGNLVILGRADQQVKIRGFRVELGEIETRLVEHPDVHQAVVQPYGDGSDARLVAYIVADERVALAQHLRTHLLNLLPHYMVPAAYVCIPSLPLTPNGKLNKRALPAPNDESFAREQYEAPQGEMEEKLAQIWRELLNIDRISRHDNFFALGGHSLLVVKMLAQLRQTGLDTTVRELFDAPNLATLASTLDHHKSLTIPPNLITANSTEISPAMLPLITLSQADIDSIAAQIPGGIANIQDIYGLAPVQSGMLYYHVMAKEGDPYMMTHRFRFIDRTALERYANAIQQVIERHDIFRTAIFWEGLSEPAQVVLHQVPSIFTEINLNESDKPILDRLTEEFDPQSYRFDLTQAPLLRLQVAEESDGSWVALQLMHHIISDYFSRNWLNTEIKTIMDGNGETLKNSQPYRHFVAQTRLGMSQDEHTRFFSEMLSNIDEPTLPFGLTDIDQDESDDNEAHLKLPQALNDQLRAHARNLKVNLASICHLAWAQVLAKASGREKVVFGTILLGRWLTGEGSDNVMGPTINTLPIRLNIDGKGVVASVHDAHARLSALLTHEHAPLVLAQSCSKVPTGLPLFNTYINCRHNQRDREIIFSLPGVSLLDKSRKIKYPLGLSMDDNYKSLTMSIRVLSPISAARVCAYMQQSLESLVDALAHRPQQPIRNLRVIPSDERTLQLHSWNQTTVVQSTDRCIHQVFEAQVECNKLAIAVECEGHTLSYSELNIRANRLAHYLIAQGVKPDDRIVLCVERSTAMIVAILGILKAGCAYVQLDPSYPSQRLTNILHDADAAILLADSAGRSTLGSQQVPVIELENLLLVDMPIDNPDASKLGLTPAHLAHIIYTSGSTGAPKGVMVEHQHIVRHLEATHNKFDFNKQDKWCLLHSFSFDMSLSELWGALWCGGQLLIVPHHITQSIDELYDWICSNGISVLIQTPSEFKMVMRSKNINVRNDQLRYIICGGETLDPSIVKDWYEDYDNGHTIIVNSYGSTETTMIATASICDSTVSEKSIIPIGRPLSHKLIYLLDSQREPVPIGATGEIYIGGTTVTHGYLNRSELTADRFLHDPFQNDPAARMFQTGDLARYLPDGNLVYLGRADQQVKIRGFRVEFGEIEAHLVEHPDVQEAVVQAYSDGSDTLLVAYIVADERIALAQQLRTHLLSLLPYYMVPSAYVCLSSLPLTPSGKLDRRSLPAPESFARQQYEAPQGETEEKLAQIWRELLDVDHISRHDNFFELGGHSLTVMHLVNKVKSHNMHIEARGVFSFPILKELAEQITNNHSKRFYSDVSIPVRQYGNEVPLFLLPDGEGDISYAFELAHDIDKNIPIYVLPWPSPENEQPTSIEEMARTMITRIKAVRSNGPIAIAGYSSGGIAAYEMAKQLINSKFPVSFLGLIDTPAPCQSRYSVTEMISTKFKDSKWWDCVSKLSVSESNEEIRKTSIDLDNIDIEWEASLSKQRLNYQNICAAVRFESLPMTIHFFKANIEKYFNDTNTSSCNLDEQKHYLNCTILGWEKYILSTNFNIIPIDGDHFTMITDAKNRSLLGKQLTRILLEKNSQ